MSNSHGTWRGCAATLTLLAGLVLPTVSHAQSLTQRIAQVRNGTVRLSFASRAGVCGNGKDAIRMGDQIFVGSGTTFITGRGSFGLERERECMSGPVRVTLTKSDGEIVGVKTAVSGTWRTTEGTDLGTVSAPEAARFFLTLAPMSEERSNKQAVLPAVLADSAVIWPELLRIAKTPSYSIKLRSRMLGWVGMTGDARALPPLDSIAGDDSSAPDLQSAAVAALADLPDEIGIPSVIRIAKGNGSLKARKQAVFWLGQSESVEGRRAVHELVRRSDTPEAVRDDGIFALGQNGEPEDLRKLRALYPELPDKLRKKMVFAVSQSGDPESLRWVISVALNGNESHAVRKHALFSAGQGGASMRELIGLWEKIEDRKLREQLLFVYSQREESEATDKLVSVAKSDPDRDLRKKAMFWLSQKDDERAAKFIREVLKP